MLLNVLLIHIQVSFNFFNFSLSLSLCFFQILADGSLSDTAVSFSQDVLERERLRGRQGGGGGVGGPGMVNAMGNDAGGMGKKSSSTSQLSAAGKSFDHAEVLPYFSPSQIISIFTVTGAMCNN